MSSRRNKERRDVLGGIGEPSSLQESTDAIYRPSDEEDARPMELRTGRIVAKPVDIMTIWADILQPRRAIPLSVRGQWDGNPEEVVKLLNAWREIAENAIQQELNVKGILKGRGDGIDYTDAEGKPLPLPPVTKSFVSLLQLGASILKDRLINPITISPRGDIFLIETGERRWLAHHLLAHFVSKDYLKISATEVQRDVWRQATENNNRDPLTAIQMARQLALLVMDMYEGDDGVKFDPIHHLVVDGGCDRRFYAQVANGNVWQIKSGFAERVQAAMGLTSYRMVSAYRKLLRYTDDDELNDEIWMKADLEGWTEGAIRTYFSELNKPSEPESVDTPLPTGKGHEEKTPVDKSQWASYQWVGREALAGGVKVFVTNCTAPETVMVQYPQADGTVKEVPLNIFALEAITPPKRDSDNADNQKPDAPVDKFGLPLMKGQTVKTRTGHTAVVVDVQGRMIALESEDNKYLPRLHYPETLEIVQPDSNGQQLAVGDAVMTDDGRGVGWIKEFVSGNVAKVETPIGTWAYGVPRLKKVEQKPNTLLAPPQKALTPSPSPSGRGEQTDLEKSAYPDMVGKPLLWDGQPVFGVSKASDTTMLVHLGNGDREEVPMAELVINEDAMQKRSTDTAKKNGTRQGVVFAEDDAIRLYLMPYRALAVALEDEHAVNAIEWLAGLTYERTNREQLDAAMSHVMTHIEDINARVEMTVFELCRLKLESLN